MVTFFRRLFIRHYQNVDDPSVRHAHGIFASVFGIVTNAILVLLKGGAALFLASQNGWILSMALIGDAINNLGDMASSLVTLIGFKLANIPADKEHPFGHRRIEYIAGLIVAMFVVFAAVELFKESLTRVIEGGQAGYDWIAIVVLGISVLLKIGQGYMNFGIGKAISSPALKATAIDSSTDAIATTFVLISGVLGITVGWTFLDGYMGLAVSLFVLYSGIRMIKETASPLIGNAYSKPLLEAIEQEVAKYPAVKGTHDVIVHSYGPSVTFVTLHAEIDEKTSLIEAHEIIDAIEKKIATDLRCDIVIHIDPVCTDNPEITQLKEKAIAVLQSLEPTSSLHDFRVRTCQESKTICFEALLPYSCKREDEILAKLKTELCGPNDTLSVHFDRPFAEE